MERRATLGIARIQKHPRDPEFGFRACGRNRPKIGRASIWENNSVETDARRGQQEAKRGWRTHRRGDFGALGWPKFDRSRCQSSPRIVFKTSPKWVRPIFEQIPKGRRRPRTHVPPISPPAQKSIFRVIAGVHVRTVGSCDRLRVAARKDASRVVCKSKLLRGCCGGRNARRHRRCTKQCRCERSGDLRARPCLVLLATTPRPAGSGTCEMSANSSFMLATSSNTSHEWARHTPSPASSAR